MYLSVSRPSIHPLTPSLPPSGRQLIEKTRERERESSEWCVERAFKIIKEKIRIAVYSRKQCGHMYSIHVRLYVYVGVWLVFLFRSFVRYRECVHAAVLVFFFLFFFSSVTRKRAPLHRCACPLACLLALALSRTWAEQRARTIGSPAAFHSHRIGISIFRNNEVLPHPRAMHLRFLVYRRRRRRRRRRPTLSLLFASPAAPVRVRR